MKKKITLSISRVFPLKHSRRGELTDFDEKIIAGTKKHIIRRNLDIWKLNEDRMKGGNYYISICQWAGKPYSSQHVEVTRLNTPITVQPIAIAYHADSDSVSAKIDGKELGDVDFDALTKNEGLTPVEFKEWFFGENQAEDKTFRGVIVHFTNLKY